MDINQAKEIAKEIYDGKVSTEEFIEGTPDECHRKVIADYFQEMVDRDNFKHRDDDGTIWTQRDPIYRAPKAIRTWGTKVLDKTITPIEDHCYVLMAGDQNSGKTAYMLDLAIKNAKAGLTVLFYSLEMTDDQILSRFALQKAGITIEEYRERNIPEHKRKIYTQYRSELAMINGLIFKGTGDNRQTLDEMLDEMRELKPDLVILDNLGLINESGRNEPERHMNISRKLIAFTNNENIPVILVHHTRKKTDKNDQTVRGTQKLLDDADIVVLCGRKTRDRYPDMSEEEEKEFYIRPKKARLFGECVEKSVCVYFSDGTFNDDSQPGFVEF